MLREESRQLVAGAAVRELTKAAVRKFRPQLAASVADALLALIPRTDKLLFEFLRGVIHGFSAGAVEHYLAEVDDRFERQTKKLYNAALNWATKGVHRAHAVYQKISTAIHKLMGVYEALKTVWTEGRARLAAAALGLLGQHVGLAFLLMLFVVVYLDYVHRGGLKDKKARDDWAKQQRDASRS